MKVSQKHKAENKKSNPLQYMSFRPFVGEDVVREAVREMQLANLPTLQPLRPKTNCVYCVIIQ